MNEFTVIANEPLEINGQRYAAEDSITLHCNLCAPLLVTGRVRLASTPAPKRRGRRTYRRRDMQAEQTGSAEE